MTDRVQELISFAIENGQIPRYLYKYRDCSERSKQILKDKEIWFSSPESFNDPFDCNLSEIKTHSQDDANKYLDYLSKQPGSQVLESIKQPSIQELEIAARDANSKSIKKTGVLCLSRNFDNILMWSHYSEYHKGFVIEFDLTQDLEFFSIPIVVNYLESYLPTNYFYDPEDAVRRKISTKSSLWSYEGEVRIMKKSGVGLHGFLSRSVNRVIFGCRTEDQFKNEIKTICASSLPHVSFDDLRMSYAKFSLEVL